MKIGFIGCGKMAGAILRGMAKAQPFAEAEFYLSDRNAAQVEKLATDCGAVSAESNRQLAEAAEVILLCVKPGDIAGVLTEIQPALTGKLLISIAAGVTLARLQQLAGAGVAIIRAMPNTPALVHEGAAAFTLGDSAAAGHAALAEKIFGAVGTVDQVAESALDAVTGVSGSGPAYIYTVIEAMADGGVLMGLPRELATRLATQTVIGAGQMVRQTQEHPAALRDMVTSPGGTTIAALETLEASGLRAALIGAVRAATEKSVAMRESGK